MLTGVADVAGVAVELTKRFHLEEREHRATDGQGRSDGVQQEGDAAMLGRRAGGRGGGRDDGLVDGEERGEGGGGEESDKASGPQLDVKRAAVESFRSRKEGGGAGDRARDEDTDHGSESPAARRLW